MKQNILKTVRQEGVILTNHIHQSFRVSGNLNDNIKLDNGKLLCDFFKVEIQKNTKNQDKKFEHNLKS